MSVILACDLGSTSFRGALIDEAGTTQAEHVLGSAWSENQPGRSEIDPEAWWRLLLEVAAALSRAAPAAFADVCGIAICGITRTQVFLDAAGRPIGPAITWKDTRSAPVAAALAGRFTGWHGEAAALNASHPFARLAWLREADPAAFRRLACVLEPKDYLNYRLTGQQASDPVSQARLLAAAAPADDVDLFAAIGLSAAVLPRLLEPWDSVGGMTEGLPTPLDRLAGVPVLCCSNDTWAAVTGLGAMRPGYAYNISGTTEVLGMVSDTPWTAEGLLTVDWRGAYQVGGPSQNGADAVPWLLSLMGHGGDGVGREIDRLLAGIRQHEPVIFLPYLRGERAPYWDPDLRGAFVGLNARHGPTDLAWAVLEGVAFLNRIVLERAEAACGHVATEIRLGGGGGGNPLWRQVKADICRRPIVVGTAREPGLLGAAMVAWTGLGRFPSLAAAQEALVRPGSRHVPDPGRAEVYDRLFAVFRRSEQALLPVSHALATFTGALSHRPQDLAQ